MSDAVQREWRFYLDDMIGFSRKVIAYTDDFDQSRIGIEIVTRLVFLSISPVLSPAS